MNSLGLRSFALVSLLPIMACSSSGATSDGGTAGATGSAGTMGAAGTGGSSATGTAGSQSVLERNRNPTRDGHFPQPTLTKVAAATKRMVRWPAVTRKLQRRGTSLKG